MRSSSFSRNHPYAKTRGWVSPKRAASSLPTITDGVNEVDDASEIYVVGGSVREREEGVAEISFGGQAIGSNSAGGTGGGANAAALPVRMFNSSGLTLIPGDVVVTDPAVDSGVTTTATASNIRIAGIVQAPIDVAQWGPVLFNGFAPIVNTTGTVSRGNYALTSATAKLAGATAARVAGSFAVYLTGTDFPDFVTASATTEEEVAATELEITMPINIPAGRVLFLALWLESGVSAVDVDGWTLIGSESGFYYYYKISESDDTATATWTTASIAVAVVLLLHPSVAQAVPIQSHDYDTSTSAATVSGLSDSPRYAIAGVKATATPGSGFSRLGGGLAGFTSSGTPALVQSRQGDASGTTFSSAVTAGNVMVAVPFKGNSNDTYETDPRLGGSCPEDPAMTDFIRGLDTNTNPGFEDGNNAVSIQGKVIADSYAGPFSTDAGCTSNVSGLVIMEFENIGISGYETLTAAEGGTSSDIDCGTFASVDAEDVVIMAIVWKDTDGGGDGRDPLITPNGFTEVFDGPLLAGRWGWVGYKIGDGDASVTSGNAMVTHYWAAGAVKLEQGTASVAGTLAGKYIGHLSSATSPFTGGGAQNDAIFAFNLTADAKASALLYGPDLGAGSGSEPTADAHIADTSDAHDASAVSLLDTAALFTATDVEAAIAELAAKDIGYQAHGNMGASETFSALTGWHSGTFNADCTFTFSGATSGIVASMVLELLEDGTGTWGPTWPGSVVWPGGSAPTHNETAGTTTIYLFQSRDGGTTWYGFQAGGSTVGDLDDLSDVTITSPAEDEQLQYISGQWVNNARRWEPVTHNFGSGPELVWSGDDLVMEWKEY